jgi:hypothetical protein
MYNVKQEDDKEFPFLYRVKLIITDDEGAREYFDRGEPENNSFYRDYSWVQTELNNAYEQGKKDGRESNRLRSR